MLKAASLPLGDAMNSIGVYEVDLWIKGQNFTHPVIVITELNNNIISIDFMHRNKLIYDVNTRQVKFVDSKINAICAKKQVTILAMTSSIFTAKFNGEKHADKTYVATIHCPGFPTLTGVPSIPPIDENHNCQIIIENCAPYEVTIERKWDLRRSKTMSFTQPPKSARASRATFQALPGLS
jgi:hypothetical protein